MFHLQTIVAFSIAAPRDLHASWPRFLLSGSHKTDADSPKLSPSVIIIIILLTVIFFLSGLLHIVARCLIRYSQTRLSDNSRNASIILQGQLQHLFSLHDSGVEQAFIDALPLFFYKSVRGQKDAADCAVCLSEFQGDDRLRLLPICSHAFHIDCIDTWLLSHSTCPLCRRSLLPDPVAADSAADTTHGQGQGLQVDADRHASNLSEAFARNLSEAAGDASGEGAHSAEIQTILPVSEEGALKMVSVQLGRFCAMATGLESTSVMGSSASGRRSYSLGSYEYVINPSSLEVMIAPTPLRRRWANCKPPTPGHRNALSDFTPDCSLEDSSAAFSEDLSHSLTSSCFCPRDASAYSKHKTSKAVDGGGGQLKQCRRGVSNADVKLMHSPVCEANMRECSTVDTVVDVPCSPRMSIEGVPIQRGGVGSRRYLIARKTLQWLMGRERRFVYPAANP